MGQCAAQMYGASLFNRKEENGAKAVFGCVTTGEDWQFLKLEDGTIWIDQDRYYIDNLGGILGMMQTIIYFYESDGEIHSQG